jgi:hypothetical protein
MSALKTLLISASLAIALLILAGCTVRGGWPRFLRPGESWGWSGPAPNTNTWHAVTNR